MKDQRLRAFKSTVESLVESLEALVRVSRWAGTDAPPKELTVAVSKLVDRLGVASRLSSTQFHGTVADTYKVTAMCTAMKRLDAAYVTFRKESASRPNHVSDAAATLELEICEATVGAG